MPEGENLKATLAAYQFQIHQVKTALDAEPENEELLQLKKDLEDVIKLTNDLIEAENVTATKYQKTGKPITQQPLNPYLDQKIDNIQETEEIYLSSKPWQVGDPCLAPWSSDNCSRPGRIISIEQDRGFCTVYFEKYDHTETVEIVNIRRPPIISDVPKSVSKARNKAELEKMKRKKHKKKQDKRVKLDELEKAHEVDKQKWQSFFNADKNKLKGLKKNVYQKPEVETGKVGIGSNASGAKPSTKYHIRPHPTTDRRK